MRLEFTDVTVRLGDRTVLDQVSLHVAPGEVLGLLGPNGSGKSTLLRTVYRTVRPHRGTVRVGELDVWRSGVREVARHVAVLTQDHSVDVELDALDLVLLGRIPHRRLGGTARRDDLALARQSLARVDASHLAHRPVPTLSGGERQRVLLARALAQQPHVLLLDEPTNHLDIAHQLHLLHLVRELGTTAVVALHDLTLAATYCDRIALLQHGQVVAHGSPRDVLTETRVRDVYDVTCDVLTHPRTGRALLALDLPPQGAETP
ncbi:ABC transporter ATP-binding protein [Actinopolymorpha alba]|uniref:ABC transporter ATP-binding protein n=1 Tax=Actinopolymorpha alba TaxID=533267 RepID=UPI00036CBA0E|nr:ABC transporter ATP-binding protein [Actinopolymorpha alba]